MEEQKDRVRLLFVGSPLLDISTECDDDLLRHFGLKEDDCVRSRDEDDPLFQRLFVSDESRLAAGGSAQNAARVAKWTLGYKGEVAFAGCAGDDVFESWMRKRLESEGVEPLYFKVPGDKTGVCACLLSPGGKTGVCACLLSPGEKTGVCACLLSPGGKRSMCTRQGAAAKFSVQNLKRPDFVSWLEKAQCIFVVGYFLVHSPDAVVALTEMCHPEQVFSLSLSAPYVCRGCVAPLLRVMPRVDVLFGNEAEVRAFATEAAGGLADVTVEDALLIIRRLPRSKNAPSRIVVVTRGPEPLLMDDGSDVVKTFDVPRDVDVADGVGCGDALSGAFLAAYVRDDRNVESAAMEGIRAATRVLQVHGCNPTTFDDV